MLSNTLIAALHKIGWLRNAGRSDEVPSLAEAACLLRWILESNQRGCSFSLEGNRYRLSRGGLRRIERLVANGTQLTRLLRPWQDGIDTWIGSRLYLSHASYLNGSVRYTSIVSSRMGSGQRHVPDWPRQVDSVLASCQQLKHQILLVRGTATHELVRTAVVAASVPWVEVGRPLDKKTEAGSVVDWLVEQLDDSQVSSRLSRQIAMSPTLPGASAAPLAEASTLANLPLQDRIAVGLPDRVIGLSARPNGTINSLLRMRATDLQFPDATTYIAMRSRGKQPRSRDGSRELLSSGVVGWVIREQPNSNRDAGLLPCGQEVVPIQLSCPIAGCLNVIDETDWHFLTHCTRGSSGPRPLESADEYRRRTWIEGVKTPHPLLTLAEILRARVIRCNDALFRDAKPVVSFSAVPLRKLLNQRKFQPQLGRWDWEPYGLMIRARALHSLGAKPVIYGDNETFKSLSSQQRSYFQPKKRKSKSADWESEQEWRVPGDVRLGDLLREDVLVFVASKSQARSLSRVSRWPVVWTQEEEASRG